MKEAGRVSITSSKYSNGSVVVSSFVRIGVVVLLLWSGYEADADHASCSGEDPTNFKDLVYRDVATFPCVRLFYRDGDVGCRTPSKDGTRGPLFMIASEAALAAYVSGASNLPQNPVVVVEPAFLTESLMTKSGELNVAGVLVLYDIDGISSVTSPASRTPQASGSPDISVNPTTDPTFEWNPSGRNVLSTAYPFPVFAVGRCDSAWLREKMSDVEDPTAWPRYTAKLNDYMGPRNMTSVECLRQGACQPLGGQSVWASKGSISRDDGKNIILATAAMDSTALFHDLSYGGESAVSALVTLLAAADALKSINASALDARIVFAAFQSEAYGFSGSRRWRDDVLSFECSILVNATKSPSGVPICIDPLYKSSLAFAEVNPARLTSVIAVDQVGRVRTDEITNTFYLHETSILSGWSSAFSGLNVPDADVVDVHPSGVLPPTPASTFYGTHGALNATSVAVLAGYNSSFRENALYRSRTDRADTLNATRLTAAATFLARALVRKSGGGPTTESVSADPSLVDSMVDCFARSPDCELFQRYTGYSDSQLMSLYTQSDDYVGVPLYVSVYSQPYLTLSSGNRGVRSDSFDGVRIVPPESFANSLERFVRNFLADVTSDTSTIDRSSCSSGCTLPSECIDASCVPTPTAYYHSALDPAFNETDYGRYEIVGEGPAWTEPYWDGNFGPSLGVSVYLDDQDTFEWVTFLFGLLFSAASFFASRKSLDALQKLKVL